MKYEKFMVVADVHGNVMHKPTVKAALDFKRRFKPNKSFHLGDNFNFAWLRKAATDDEKMDDVQEDFQNGCWFLEQYQPDVLLWGNHDQRLVDALDNKANHGYLKQLAEDWIAHIKAITPKCLHLPYDKRKGVHRYGDTNMLHGYSHGNTAARKTAFIYGKCIVGHVHRRTEEPVESLEDVACFMPGCLCQLDQGYNRTHLGALAQKHGWIYGIKTKGGKLVIQTAKFIDGKWYTPDNF